MALYLHTFRFVSQFHQSFSLGFILGVAIPRRRFIFYKHILDRGLGQLAAAQLAAGNWARPAGHYTRLFVNEIDKIVEKKDMRYFIKGT